METTYRVTSYDSAAGKYLEPGKRLEHVVTCLSESDACAVADALEVAGFAVVVLRIVSTTSHVATELVAY